MNQKDERFLRKLCENSCILLELFRDLSEERQQYILDLTKEIAEEERKLQNKLFPDSKP
ncbi:MAG: hypothetical protein ACI4LH_02750 [Candidatus Heritagella sp.]